MVVAGFLFGLATVKSVASSLAAGGQGKVQYAYSNGSTNTIRMTSMTYPDGRVLDYDYGTSGSQTDRLDRVASIVDGAQTLVDHEYSGGGQLVTQSYPEPGIDRTLALGSGSDPYSALDRFGRMIDLRWTKSSTDLVRFDYGYDRSSNRLFERNKIDGSGGANPAMDGLFGIDELNRLDDFKSGELNTGGTAITSPTKTQDWTLDETGNWKQFNQTVVGAVAQSRTHNSVNEITNITETSGAAWATPAHDTAGSMTSIPKPSDLTSSYDATWDAWNRLVKLSDSSVTVVTYDYDGSNRRVIKTLYSSGSPSETRHVYYSAGSQVLEERLGSSSDADQQFVWNLGYVDDLVLRDRDTTANGTLDERLYSLRDLRYCVMALANSSGTILERFSYEAYGRSSAMTSLFVSRSSSSYDWEFRYTGRREDLESGLLFFRARYYSAELGRFISRDPLGFVDGMSLYRAYFVLNGVDPAGLMTVSRGETTLSPCGGYATNFKYTAEKVPQDVKVVVYVQKICLFSDAYVVDCESKDGCCLEKERKDCKPCCYIEVLGGKKPGGSIGDDNVFSSYSKPGCTSRGSYKVTANVRAIDLDGDPNFANELKKLYDNVGKAVTCDSGCGLGKGIELTIGPYIETSEDGSRDPAWWKNKTGVLDEIDMATKTTWSCCGRTSSNWQLTKFHDQTYYWHGGATVGIPIDDPNWH